MMNKVWTMSLRVGSSLLAAVVFFGCGGGSDSSPAPTPPPAATRNVQISWSANNESRVNTTGGGYRVYLSTTSGFNITDPGVTVVDVPYVSGALAPTSTTVTLNSATTYYVRVVAYSAFPTANTSSAPSAQITVAVP